MLATFASFQTVVLEKTLESPLDSKIQLVHSKGNQSWKFTGRTDAEAEAPIPLTWKRTWCWERLKAGGGDNKGWDGWMASLTWWTWVWTSSRRQWRTGKPGVLQSMGAKRIRHDWVTEQQQRPSCWTVSPLSFILFHLWSGPKNLNFKIICSTWRHAVVFNKDSELQKYKQRTRANNNHKLWKKECVQLYGYKNYCNNNEAG